MWWAQLGSNQRPLPCEDSALPLSYAPDGGQNHSRDRAIASQTPLAGHMIRPPLSIKPVAAGSLSSAVVAALYHAR